MKTEHLEEFVDLSNTLNFTKTAKNFYITQPVLSKHIAILEQELGGRLFDRGHQGVVLTPFGQALLPAAITLVGDKNRLVGEAQILGRENVERVRVGYLDRAVLEYLPMIQQRFNSMHPDVKVSYLVYEYDKILTALDSSSVDIIIGEPLSPLAEDVYMVKPVCKDTLCLLVTQEDALADATGVRPEDLTGRAMLVPDETFFGSGAEAFMQWLKPELNNINIVGHIHDANSITLAMSMRNVIGPTLDHAAKTYGPGFKTVPLEGLDISFFTSVVWRKAAEKPFYADFAHVVHGIVQEFGCK